ncbi:MAG: hypothetical protein KF718_06065 [Polyangiaceae bacterium]|nr:hypothetical protein [Polyangiaceae bacterium]
MYVSLWFRAFLVTWLSEACVAVPMLRATRESRLRRFGAVTLVNVASHPAVWFVFPELGMTYLWMFVVAETWAVSSETLAYRLVFPKLGWLRALAIALIANGVSVAAGLLLRAVGVPL